MDKQEMMSLIGSVQMVWLVVFFAGLIAWAFWPTRRAEMDRNSRIPLRDDDYRDDTDANGR
ncbi:MAG: cbb3-type cytochrome c oxidase subunit 3 [Proteobacteria bacterium]|nr:cbb3-type cytochrome c oxidase subunit 3 [Pseudomonadota bacterium]